MLSNKHVQDICGLGLGRNECRYLDCDASGKFHCLKLRPLKKDIDNKINDVFNDLNQRINLANSGVDIPLGNNCQGYPHMNTIEQGYDKD